MKKKQQSKNKITGLDQFSLDRKAPASPAPKRTGSIDLKELRAELHQLAKDARRGK